MNADEQEFFEVLGQESDQNLARRIEALKPEIARLAASTTVSYTFVNVPDLPPAEDQDGI